MHRAIPTERHDVMPSCLGAAAATIDLREIRLRDQRAEVFSAFRSLEEDQVLRLASDRSLESVYFEFVVEMPDAFHWEYLETGPAAWHADVTRLKTHPARTRRGGSPDPAAWPTDAVE